MSPSLSILPDFAKPKGYHWSATRDPCAVVFSFPSPYPLFALPGAALSAGRLDVESRGQNVGNTYANGSAV